MRVNATFLRWTGYAREDLVGVKRFQDLLTAGGRIYHETHYAPLLRMQGSVREIAVDIVARRRPPAAGAGQLGADHRRRGRAAARAHDGLRRHRARALRARAAGCATASARRASARSGWHAQTRATSRTRCSGACSAGAPPRDPRFEVATLYQPAVENSRSAATGTTRSCSPAAGSAIVVGDVVGRGLRRGERDGPAAQRGARARGRRPRAGGGARPPRHVRRAGRGRPVRDARLRRGRPGQRRGHCFAAAGHLPPVLSRRAASRELFMGGRSTPLGVAAPALAARPRRRSRSRPGDGFVLYTDGLVERRDEAIDDGLERLLAAIRDAPGRAGRRTSSPRCSRPARATTTCACSVFRRAELSRRPGPCPRRPRSSRRAARAPSRRAAPGGTGRRRPRR